MNGVHNMKSRVERASILAGISKNLLAACVEYTCIRKANRSRNTIGYSNALPYGFRAGEIGLTATLVNVGQ
jgi:hypothetical protein